MGNSNITHALNTRPRAALGRDMAGPYGCIRTLSR
jgi:hypothetical protein